MENSEMEIQSDQNLTTNIASKNFLDRKNLLTYELEKLEAEAQSKLRNRYVDDNDEDMETELYSDSKLKPNRKRTYKEMRHLVGKESIFKRPEAPISKCLPVRTQPDFKINPHKWKKYSLEDVTPEDMSNRQNTASALAFLRELEERKQKSLNDQFNEVANNDFKPVFKRTTFNTSAIIKKTIEAQTTETNDEKPKFKSSTLVMPEYRVGERKKKEKKVKSTSDTERRKKELKLSHLLEADEENDVE